VVFVDEIEKAFAGTGTDLSGVKTEMTGTMLTWMQDNEADGLIFIGPAGAAKSALAKAIGNTAGIPTIAFDLGAMQSSLVGGSGERLRAALSVVEAVSQGRALFIATCNSIASLPPELRRRFTLGTFFFDLPSADEREVIWRIYEKRYSVSGERPEDEGWTGAEIKECCRKAGRLGVPLRRAAEDTVPISKSAAEQIKSLRQQASGSSSVHRVRVYTATRKRPHQRRPHDGYGVWRLKQNEQVRCFEYGDKRSEAPDRRAGRDGLSGRGSSARHRFVRLRGPGAAREGEHHHPPASVGRGIE
jgi:SpoVK/Ycf46/Vps4 family AAA+-type ATPase